MKELYEFIIKLFESFIDGLKFWNWTWKDWLKLLTWVTVIFILEWLGIGDYFSDLGKELVKWIKSMF